ncbi:MAG: dethiobiotin synthase [Flavicella sp.]
MKKNIFVTGISTEVGKTLVSSIITEALEADYWKPIQSGELDHSDSDKVRDLIQNTKTVIHPNSYALQTPMSPHAAAEIDSVKIELQNIQKPNTENHLVIEGAGGLLVPLNDTQTIADILDPSYKVIVVSRHYLGSINHTLLTLQYLKDKGYKPSIIFSGNEHPSTESIIQKMSGVNVLGRIEEEEKIDRQTVQKYAEQLRETLETL